MEFCTEHQKLKYSPMIFHPVEYCQDQDYLD